MLLHVTDKWLKAIDEGKYTGSVFLDLAKAFDTVDHSILYIKWSYYGFQGSSSDLYAVICQTIGKISFHSEQSEWVLFLLVYPRDPFWVLCSLLYILMIYLQ